MIIGQHIGILDDNNGAYRRHSHVHFSRLSLESGLSNCCSSDDDDASFSVNNNNHTISYCRAVSRALANKVKLEYFHCSTEF